MKFYSPIKLIIVPFFPLHIIPGISYFLDNRIYNRLGFPLCSCISGAEGLTVDFNKTDNSFHIPPPKFNQGQSTLKKIFSLFSRVGGRVLLSLIAKLCYYLNHFLSIRILIKELIIP
jgi:hypothetical protein